LFDIRSFYDFCLVDLFLLHEDGLSPHKQFCGPCLAGIAHDSAFVALLLYCLFS
jgi:hypothetical protein